MKSMVWVSGEELATRICFCAPPKGVESLSWVLPCKTTVFWTPNGEGELVRDYSPESSSEGRMVCRVLGSFWKLFLGDGPEKNFPKVYGVPSYLPTRPLFYGGSFRPWHKGHMACVQSTDRPEDLIVLPDQNPHKALQLDDGWGRYQEVRSKLKGTLSSVYPGFAGLEGVNPTWNWLQNIFGEVSLLLGGDSFASLPTWQNASELAKRVAEWQVVPRGKQQFDKVEAWLQSLNPKVEIRHLQEHDFQDVSSTKIRKSR